MSFINDLGQKISYECSELIEELEQDIAEFGQDLEVIVITEIKHGVKLYKDYTFFKGRDGFGNLKPGESEETIKAVDLLEIYKKENSIL